MPGPRIPGQTTKVRSFSAFVRAADPTFDLDRRKEPAWEFEGGRVKRTFFQNINKFGPYVPSLPSSMTPPVVSGELGIGAILNCSTGEWHGTRPIDYAYQWLRDDAPIEDAFDSSYTLLDADLGAFINCVVTASNSVGAVDAASNNVGPIFLPPPANIDAPVISGTPNVGQTLSVTDGTWTNNPETYSYQWIRQP